VPDSSIHTLGKVLEHRGELLYRVSLPNGKEILAHLGKEVKQRGDTFKLGQCLLLEMTPYDFDGARILGPADLEE